MKTIVNPFTTALATAVLMVGCGNSGSSSHSLEKTEDTSELLHLVDPIKPVSSIAFDFENYPANRIPAGWSQYYSGSGGTDWKITDDDGNMVLAQLYSNNPGNHFNIVVNDSISIKDMVLNVRLRGVTGDIDQGGGFIWRFIDKENYYIVRANPLEDNVVLYKVQNGTRTDLPLIGKGRTYGVDVEPMGNIWYTLKLIVKGDLFTVFLNGKELFKVQDNTFSNAGKIGLWTKADAVTWFDDFEITY